MNTPDVWSCTTCTCGAVDLGVVLVKGSFPGPFDMEPYLDCEPWLKPIIEDAVRGGAVIKKGVGLDRSDD